MKRGVRFIGMDLNKFSWQVAARREQVAELNLCAREALLQQQELLVRTFEELYAALEDLQAAEEVLRQQNQVLAVAYELDRMGCDRYHTLLDSIPYAYLITDVEGVIREANSTAARLLNIPQEFLVNKPLAVFVAKEDRWAFRCELTWIGQTGCPREWEMYLQPRNEPPFRAALMVTVVPCLGVQSIALHWLLHDITNRDQEILQPLKSIVQGINEAAVVTSAELDEPGPRIVFANSAFTEMTGYTPEELTGKTPRILQGPKTDRSVLQQLRRNLLQGQPFHGETVNYRKDGTEYHVELHCIPICNESGGIMYFVSIQRHTTG